MPKFPGLPTNSFVELFNVYEVGSYAESAMETSTNSIWPFGRIRDYPLPDTTSMGSGLVSIWSVNVPIEWLKLKNDLGE